MRMTYLFLLWFPMIANAGEPLNIKGVKLGMSKAQVKQLIGGKWECYGESLPSSVRAAHLKRNPNAPEECGHAITPNGHRDSYAGMPVDIDYFFDRDVLVKISFNGITPRNVNTVRVGLIEKFGNPARHEDSELSNAFGARFDDFSDTWESGDATLYLRKRCYLTDVSCLELRSNSFENAQAAELAKKSRDDM